MKIIIVNNDENLLVTNDENLLVTNDENQDIDIDIITNSLSTINGSDLDGYLISASGEAFNFKQLYNSLTNTFDTSGCFAIDHFYYRFKFWKI